MSTPDPVRYTPAQKALSQQKQLDGPLVRTLMEAKHITSSDMAERLQRMDISEGQSKRLAAGKVISTKLGNIYCIAEVLEEPVEKLVLGGLPEESRSASTSALPMSVRANARRYVEAAESVITKLPPDDIQLHVVSQKLNRVLGFIDPKPNGCVEVYMPVAAYRSYLESLPPEVRTTLRGIADLTDPTEQFWLKGDLPRETMIQERIFLISPADLLDSTKGQEIATLVRRHREFGYSVRVALWPRGGTNVRPPLDHRSGNVLIGDPCFVAGYTVRDGQELVSTVSGDQIRFERARHFYDVIRRKSVEVHPGDDLYTVRTRLFETTQFGWWKSTWKGPNDRTPDYYQNYDEYIRCWIPGYDTLLKRCQQVICAELIRRFRRAAEPCVILEIGIGTGGLTRHMLTWIEAANRLIRDTDAPWESRLVDHYYGLDASNEMMRQLRGKELGKLSPSTRFEVPDRGLVFRNGPGMRDYLRGRQAHILCGSLVLHELLEEWQQGELADKAGREPSDETVRSFLTTARECLAPGGMIIMADVFHQEGFDRDSGLGKWREGMARMGMGKEQIDLFYEHNPEMIQTITLRQMQQYAPEFGFGNPEFVQFHDDRHGDLRPFCVLRWPLVGDTLSAS
jgi:hypothetical protein